MFKVKKKIIGGREYKVIGSTVEWEGGRIVFKSYSTFGGNVIVEGGTVKHPDGSVTDELGNTKGTRK